MSIANSPSNEENPGKAAFGLAGGSEIRGGLPWVRGAGRSANWNHSLNKRDSQFFWEGFLAGAGATSACSSIGVSAETGRISLSALGLSGIASAQHWRQESQTYSTSHLYVGTSFFTS